MCTHCGVFVHDFSLICCKGCGNRVVFVDVSNMLALQELFGSFNVKIDIETKGDILFEYPSLLVELVDDDHVHGEDCIDCSEGIYEDAYSEGYYRTTFNETDDENFDDVILMSWPDDDDDRENDNESIS
jgi:hypothetical protein